MNNVEMKTVGITDSDGDNGGSGGDGSNGNSSGSEAETDHSKKVKSAIGFSLLFIISGLVVLIVGLLYAM